MFSRIATLLGIALFLTLLVTTLSGQRQRSYLTKARNINVKAQGLTGRVVASLGGVLSSADQLADGNGNLVSLHLEPATSTGYPGYITIRFADLNADLVYRIDYANLVPATLFVASGATSLYTALPSNASLDTPRFLEDAGFVRHPGGGYVALEFAGTPYAAAMHSLDLCTTTCLGNEITGFLRKLDVGDVPRVVPWINTDAGLTSPRPYTFTVQNGAAHVSGNIVRFYLSRSFGEVVVDRARQILGPPDDGLSTAHFLFDTLALLRALKEAHPDRWADFLTSLSAEPLVQAQPEPWELYTRNFCSVYPDLPDFFDCDGW